MKEVPKLIRDFSKESNQGERDALAQKIREERQAGRKEQDDHQFEVLKEELTNLRDQLEEISKSGWRKFADYFKLKKIREEIGVKEQELSELGPTESVDFRQKTEELLKDFYTNETKRWTESGYTAEDVEKYFNPEHLSSLSIEEYELLLQRFPSEMVTHVTRQGIRDHLGAVQHFAGLNRYWDGFRTIMSDRKLRNQLSLSMGELEKEGAIENFLKRGVINFGEYETEEKALMALENFSDINSLHHDGSLWDFTSIHVATEEVADAHYGAEKHNEIFFAFPSALIASQYLYSGQLNHAGGDYHNNQWIWTKDEEGIPIDAGIAFIPKNTPVSPQNGSRYELDEQMNPKENTELIANLSEKVLKPELQPIIKEMIPFLGDVLVNVGRVLSLKEENVPYNEKQIWDTLQKYKIQLQEVLGTSDPKIINMFFKYHSLLSLKNISEEKRDVKKIVEDMMYLAGLSFEEAKNPVRAEEYWESYFKEHPDLRPSKIVYYEQDSPTEGLIKWREGKKLRGGSEEVTKSFEENHVPNSTGEVPEHLLTISKRFKDLAKRAISQHYAKDLS